VRSGRAVDARELRDYRPVAQDLRDLLVVVGRASGVCSRLVPTQVIIHGGLCRRHALSYRFPAAAFAFSRCCRRRRP